MIQKLSQTSDLDQDLVCDLLEQDPENLRLEARWIETVGELEALIPSWRRLAEMAVRENLLFDPGFLIPAFRHLSRGNVRILVVEAPISDLLGTRVLCGLIPLIQKKFYHLPLKCYEIWRSEQCYDATPLIRKDCPFETLQAVIEFLRSDGASLLSMDTVCAESGFADLLLDVVQDRRLGLFQRDQLSRAAFRPRATVEEYMATNVSKSIRKNVGRLERRLREQGDLQFEVSDQASDFSTLTSQFLELEASGWKGREGTALACDPATQKFFEEMVARSTVDDRVSFLSLKLDGQPIAMLCDLHADGFGCSYKTAFDESFSQFSPGLLIEIKNIEYMHQVKIANMDSCTDPNNATMNRIWRDRMRFQSVVIALRRGIPNLATAAMPMLQSAARAVRKFRNKKPPE